MLHWWLHDYNLPEFDNFQPLTNPIKVLKVLKAEIIWFICSGKIDLTAMVCFYTKLFTLLLIWKSCVLYAYYICHTWISYDFQTQLEALVNRDWSPDRYNTDVFVIYFIRNYIDCTKTNNILYTILIKATNDLFSILYVHMSISWNQRLPWACK